MSDYREILVSLGYTPKDFGKSWRMLPIYRDSNNETSLAVFKDNGKFVDYGSSLTGTFESLVQITLGLQTTSEAKDYLQNKFQFTAAIVHEKPLIKQIIPLDKSLIGELSSEYNYWGQRKISAKTLNFFQGGLCSSGKMKGRYVFPIFNSKMELLGLSGRDISNKSKIKWKHSSGTNKQEWVYPAAFTYQFLKDSPTIILTESIGNLLSLYEVGIKNVIVCFGLEISLGVLNFLIKLDQIKPRKLILAFDNDKAKNEAGNNAAEKQKTRLLRYFDEKQILINLPYLKDFNDMLMNNPQDLITWNLKNL